MSTTPDYGEPWRVVSLADGGIASSDGSPIVDKLSKSHRAIACVNACAGMADPAAEIEALRARLAEAYAALSTCQNHCYSDGMVHHQTFDNNKVGRAILSIRADKLITPGA